MILIKKLSNAFRPSLPLIYLNISSVQNIYHFIVVLGYFIFGGIGELVALLDTLGCSGTVNLESVDFQTGGLTVGSQCSECAVLFRACIGILYILIGRHSGESKVVFYFN